MKQLSLTLFGAFGITIAADKAGVGASSGVHLPTDKVRALLVYLVLTPGGPLRREMLAALLWPEQPERQARQNLRKTIARLRKSLDGSDPGLSNRILTATRQTIECHATYCDSDVAAFRRNLEIVQTHNHEALWRCATCVASLEQAVVLYRQGELLAGFSLPDAQPFEAWLRDQREALYRRQLRALEQLATAREEQGDYDSARDYARMQIEHEPWREEAHRQLMRLLAVQGRRAEAFAQYQACKDILRAELDVEPSAETEALLNQVMDGSLLVQVPTPPVRQTSELPRLPHPLVGREADMAALRRLLSDADCRLLSLVGPGGIGKTTLALALARDLRRSDTPLADSVAFVSLDGLDSVNLLPSAMAQALGLSLNKRHPAAGQVAHHLRDSSLLIILDNFEPSWGQSDWLRELTGASHRIKLLLTTRAPLNWQEEWRYPLQGLSYPQEGEVGEGFEAVQLFVRAARRVQPGFRYTRENGRHIARICRLVQGWPLALEMAAGWVRMTTCKAIADQIAQSLDLLRSSLRDTPPRQRSIRVVFERTLATLSEDDHKVLAQLTVFHGGFSGPAAEAVMQAPALQLLSLIDKSLVYYDEVADRYYLHPLLRQFVAEQAEQAPRLMQNARQRHGEYYLAWIAGQMAQLRSEESPSNLAEMHADGENLRQAWLWAARRCDVGLLTRSLSALARYYSNAGLPREAIALLKRTLAILNDSTTAKPAPSATSLRAQIFYRLAQQLAYMARYDDAIGAVTEAHSLAQAADDAALVTHVLIAQANIWREQGLYDQAQAVLEQAITFSRAHGDVDGTARALHARGNTCWSTGAYELAMQSFREARRLYRQLGKEQTAAVMTGNMGTVYWRLGRHRDALSNYEVALEARRREGDITGQAIWMGNIGLVYSDLQDDERALAYLDEALEALTRSGRLFYKTEYLLGKVALYLRRGDVPAAVRFHCQALDIAQQIGNRAYLLECDLWQARLYRAQGRSAEAVQLLQLLLVREFRPNMSAIIFEELSAAHGVASAEQSAAAGGGQTGLQAET